MKKAFVTTPATREMGSFLQTATATAGETIAQNALWHYNDARAACGLPPLPRMPACTTYKPCTLVYINRVGNGYRETVDEFDTMKEARECLKEYRAADLSGHYYISIRACADWLAK